MANAGRGPISVQQQRLRMFSPQHPSPSEPGVPAQGSTGMLQSPALCKESSPAQMTLEAPALASLRAHHRLSEACGISGGKLISQMLRAILLSLAPGRSGCSDGCSSRQAQLVTPCFSERNMDSGENTPLPLREAGKDR